MQFLSFVHSPYIDSVPLQEPVLNADALTVQPGAF